MRLRNLNYKQQNSIVLESAQHILLVGNPVNLSLRNIIYLAEEQSCRVDSKALVSKLFINVTWMILKKIAFFEILVRWGSVEEVPYNLINCQKSFMRLYEIIGICICIR